MMQVSIIILSNHSVECFIPLLFSSNQLFLLILNDFIRFLIDQFAIFQVSIIILSNHSVECFIPLLFSLNQLFLMILNVFIIAHTIDRSDTM